MITSMAGIINGTVMTKPEIHIEIRQHRNSVVPQEQIEEMVRRLLHHQGYLNPDTVLADQLRTMEIGQHVVSIKLCELIGDKGQEIKESFELSHVTPEFHVFRLDDRAPDIEEIEGEEEVPAASHWTLPSLEFDGLWESLIYETDIKNELLQYVTSTLFFTDCNVDCNQVSWNRVVLLHGPPGTGKTTLCKALAQKLCMRLSRRYSRGHLIEINSHSLFSKWFSESGKLVMKMFAEIRNYLEDRRALVCILIDEVESLTRSRAAAMSGTEPSDALRVVNAVLTQIDQIKRNPNVLLLTTSNVTGAIDLAFVDRADIKHYVGYPSTAAIYQIFFSCIKELMKAGVISFPVTDGVPLRLVKSHQDLVDMKQLDLNTKHTHHLWKISSKCVGFSGRTLRKLPLMAHALYLKPHRCLLSDFLMALEQAVYKTQEDNDHFLEKTAVCKCQALTSNDNKILNSLN